MLSSSHDITLTPQEQVPDHASEEFPCSRNGTYPGRTVEKHPNANLNAFMGNA